MLVSEPKPAPSSDRQLAASIGKSTVFGVIASAAQVITRMITVPLVIHYLGLGAYGIWNIIMVTAAYMRFGGEALFVCGCGHAIAPAQENWKHYARHATTTAAELSPRISLHVELDAVRYACPSCARLLEVEIKLKGEEPLFDIEVKP